jgi:hypothetical protein
MAPSRIGAKIKTAGILRSIPRGAGKSHRHQCSVVTDGQPAGVTAWIVNCKIPIPQLNKMLTYEFLISYQVSPDLLVGLAVFSELVLAMESEFARLDTSMTYNHVGVRRPDQAYPPFVRRFGDCNSIVATAIQPAKEVVAICAECALKDATDDSERGGDNHPLLSLFVKHRGDVLGSLVVMVSIFLGSAFSQIFWPQGLSAPAALRAAADCLDRSAIDDGDFTARDSFVATTLGSGVRPLCGHVRLQVAIFYGLSSMPVPCRAERDKTPKA